MELQLLLIREADTSWDTMERVHGQISLPPLEDELHRLKALTEKLRDYAPMGVYGPDSDPGRTSAMTLARSLGLPFTPRPSLSPLDMGAWEGLSWLEVRERYGRMWRRWHAAPDRFAPPMGETMSEVASRLEPLVDEILAEERNVAIVASWPVLLSLLACALPQAAARGEREHLAALSRRRGVYGIYRGYGG